MLHSENSFVRKKKNKTIAFKPKKLRKLLLKAKRSKLNKPKKELY